MDMVNGLYLYSVFMVFKDFEVFYIFSYLFIYILVMVSYVVVIVILGRIDRGEVVGYWRYRVF